jgi:hypothetical protein
MVFRHPGRHGPREERPMSTENEYKGRCFCGAVELRVTGKPAAMGYCHCTSCRQWSAAPVNAFTLWQPSAVTVTRGADQVGAYNKTPNSIRKWCKVCGGHLYTEHPPFKLVDVYAATIPELAFAPMLHVNYSETVLPMRDGLPKMKDFPADLGGTGIAVPE